MKKWFKFFGATVASAAASAVLGSLTTNPNELGNFKLLGQKAAAGAIIAAVTLIANNPLKNESTEADELKKSANNNTGAK